MEQFSEYYFKEARLGIGRKIANIFSNQKEIDIDIQKDIVDVGYFGETNHRTFNEINRSLSDSFKDNIKLIKNKKLIGSSDNDKILSRYRQRKREELQYGTQIINVFKANIKNVGGLLGNYSSINSAIAYETGRNIIHNGYIVLIITSQNDKIEYFVGADKLGMKFFQQIFGTNIDLFININKDNKITQNKVKKIDLEKSEESEESDEDILEDGEYNTQDISKEDFEYLEKIWGNGKKGGFVRGGEYDFKDKFERKNHYDANTGHTGYKYINNKGNIAYLMDTGDNEHYYITFKDKLSYDWAKAIRMLSHWKN